jgi:hypothetical protein
MTDALLIAGNAKRFVEEAIDLQFYLRHALGMGRKRIHRSQTAYVCEWIFADTVKRIIAQRAAPPLLVLYSGHGSVKGWALDDTRMFSYEQLADALVKATRPVVIINDCCHAMAAASVFNARGLPPSRVCLIGASEADEIAAGGLLSYVLSNWQCRRPVRLGPELRWGERLDHHFFAPVPSCQARSDG